MNIQSFVEAFSSESDCVEFLAKRRWPSGPVCDTCGSINFSRKLKKVRCWCCRVCGKEFSVTVGTPMEHTRLPLTLWFLGIFLIATSSKGVSAMVIKRQLGITYKSAWFLCHRIRALLDQGDELLKGVVEVDETYIGNRGKRLSIRDDVNDQPKGRAGSRNLMVVTAVERNGRAKAKKGKTHSGRTIAEIVFSWIDLKAILVTDELPAYRKIGRKYSAHFRVNHSRKQWISCNPLAVICAHTNTVESFNATIKRAITGVWHWFSIKHADRYLCELEIRWNMRKLSFQKRFEQFVGNVPSSRLSWKMLTA